MIIRITYEQRITLADILTDKEKTDAEKFVEVIKSIRGKELTRIDSKEDMRTFENVCETIKHWMEIEAKLLAYVPTADELAAGYNDLLTTKFGTAIDLAEQFGCMPNDILAMDYEDVFSILWHNKEMRDYEERLTKIKSNKM